jgi:hypothetical protein
VQKYHGNFVKHPKGFGYLLKEGKVENMRVVAEAYKKVGFGELKKFLYGFIIEEGTAQLGSEQAKQSNVEEFMSILFTFYENYSTLISQGFPKNSEMQSSFKISFEELLQKTKRVTEGLYKLVRSRLDQGKFEQI